VLSWFGAYYRPGRLTCGLDVWMERQEIVGEGRGLQATLRHIGPADHGYTVIAALAPGHNYDVHWNGQPAPYTERLPGVLEIALRGEGELVVSP
jgi:hypothetical protein